MRLLSARAGGIEGGAARVDRSSGRRFRLEGFFSELFVSLTGGAFLTGTALALGATPLSLALLAAVPFMAQVGQLIAPWLEQRLGSRRRFVIPALALARGIWMLPVVLLALGLKGALPLTLAILSIGLMSLLGMVAQNGWMTWMMDLIPTGDRLRHFGHRAWSVSLAMLLITPAGALALDGYKEQGQESFGLMLLGAVGVVFGLMGALSLAGVPDKAPEAADPEPLPAVFRRLTQRKGYRRVLVLFGLWHGSVGLPAPFWTLYMLQHLGMSFSLITIHTCLILIVRLLCGNLWAAIIERAGSRKVLIACAFFLSANPLWWVFAERDFYWPLWIEATISGVCWTGFNQAAFVQPIAGLKLRDRSKGLAFFHVLTGLPLFVASMIGGLILEGLGAHKTSTFIGIFVASAVLRALTTLLALRLTEPGTTVRAFFVSFIGNGLLRRPVGRAAILIDEEPPSGPKEVGAASE